MKITKAYLFFITIIFFSCKPDKIIKPYHVTVTDGENTYKYNGDTLSTIISQGDWQPNFSSSAGIGMSGNTNYYETKSEFRIKLGNISRLNLSIAFQNTDSATVADLKPSKPNQTRLFALQKIIRPGLYIFNTYSPFFIYTTEVDKIWITDLSQSNSLEILSTALNSQDGTANKIVAQINFDIGLKGSNFSAKKRIKGSIYSFFNL
jgi:hypothetical protein